MLGNRVTRAVASKRIQNEKTGPRWIRPARKRIEDLVLRSNRQQSREVARLHLIGGNSANAVVPVPDVLDVFITP